MTNIYDQIAEQGACFNVRKEEVFTASGEKYSGRVAIVNELTGKPLGLVSPGYRVVTNDEVARHVSDSLEASGLDLTGADAKVRFSHGGARSMVQILLPAVQVEPRPGDTSQFQIAVLNSYDGRWKFMARAGAIRVACLNGCIMGDIVGQYSAYHNSKLDVELGASKMVRMAEDFIKSEDWFRQMIDRKVDREQLLRSLAIFLTGSSKIKDREAFLKLPTVRKLEELYLTYSAEMGENAYALYNALTDYITHRKRGANTAPAAELNEQLRVEKTVLRQKLFSFVED